MLRLHHCRIICTALACLVTFAAVQSRAWADPTPTPTPPPDGLNFTSTSTTNIVLRQAPNVPEQMVAVELKNYLTAATGGDFVVTFEPVSPTIQAIYIGDTDFSNTVGIDATTLASEEWRMKLQQNALVLAGGGTRGTNFAVYRFLEDYVGIRWWNPWEESVPAPQNISIAPFTKSGKPALSYRDIYMLYGNDYGHFAIRNRLNRAGDEPISTAWGGARDYGPPAHVHTMYDILPISNYDTHPDWYLIRGSGPPTRHNSQLKMSNPAMRQEFLSLLLTNITNARNHAITHGLVAPDTFSVSQMDNTVPFADPNNPADALLVANNGGADAAVLLDFINFLADSVKVQFPDVYIDTLAYYSGEQAPTQIQPRDNVIIRLTDTKSNLLLPVTHARNHVLHDNLVAWGNITNNLRVWDYAVTFNYIGLPMPTAFTYQPDLQFMRQHNVDGIFVEHEFPILADMRDFKVWMQCKLYEDPNRDFDTLVQDFTDGFYGPAGVHVRNYIYALNTRVHADGAANGYEEVGWMTMAKQYSYLTLDFLIQADGIFDQAALAAGTDTVLQRRVRHARLSLDRYMALWYGELATEWINRGNGNTLANFPLNLTTIVDRAVQTWKEQADIRLPVGERAAEYTAADAQLANLKHRTLAPIPAQFQNKPPGDVKLFTMGGTRNDGNLAKVVADPSSDVGIATRLLVNDVPVADQQRYGVPMAWGIYDIVGGQERLSTAVITGDVTASGYNWYKMGETALGGNDYMFFFWSWIIQLDIAGGYDKNNPNQVYEVWANIKYDGPNLPHGNANNPNSISIDRVALIKK
jgi:hypothetical protein